MNLTMHTERALFFDINRYFFLQSNLVSGQVGYEELAGGFKPIRNGEIF